MRPSDKATWAAAVLLPLVLIALFSNALVYDVQTYKSLLAPGALIVTIGLLDYYQGRGMMPDIFDERERAHLEDVKGVFNALGWLSLALLIVFLALLRKADAYAVFTRGFIILLVIVMALWLAPFDSVFTKFHEMFFPAETWRFHEQSTLIRLYPFGFFQAFFTAILEHSLLFGAVLALWARARPR